MQLWSERGAVSFYPTSPSLTVSLTFFPTVLRRTNSVPDVSTRPIAKQITAFCTLNYGTTFPRFAKVDVNGKEADPLFVWLKKQQSEDIGDADSKSFEKKVKMLKPFAKPEDIKWNFGKFVIDRNGDVVARYSPAYTPDKLDADIAKLL